MAEDMHKSFMAEAIRQAEKNISNGNGGPFGAVIVKDGKLIAAAGNKVTSTNDPTAHAEVVAIREACRELDTFDLSGCEIYASCEPCPMCLGAIMWARIEKLYFAADRKDAAEAGFDDELFYREINLPAEVRQLPSHQISREDAVKVLEQWIRAENKIHY
jgi:tRNA(Arg) A34 adenosine deaminase TadA